VAAGEVSPVSEHVVSRRVERVGQVGPAGVARPERGAGDHQDECPGDACHPDNRVSVEQLDDPPQGGEDRSGTEDQTGEAAQQSHGRTLPPVVGMAGADRPDCRERDPRGADMAEAKINRFTAVVDVTHIEKMLRWAKTDNEHHFFSDERIFGGNDSAPEPLQYFTAATGF
jgi:hypothetical protein